MVRATAYRAARLGDRQNAHRALAQATHPGTDPDRRAWHLAQVLTEPDEDVAGELERMAGRAQERGGIAAKAAFLERAAIATPDVARRTEDASPPLLSCFRPASPPPRRSCSAWRRPTRWTITGKRAPTSCGPGSPSPWTEAPTRRSCCWTPHRQLSRFDAAEARVACLDAIRAALFAGRQVAPGGTMTDVARAAREATGADIPRAGDVLRGGPGRGLQRGIHGRSAVPAAGPERHRTRGDRRSGAQPAAIGLCRGAATVG